MPEYLRNNTSAFTFSIALLAIAICIKWGATVVGDPHACRTLEFLGLFLGLWSAYIYVFCVVSDYRTSNSNGPDADLIGFSLVCSVLSSLVLFGTACSLEETKTIGVQASYRGEVFVEKDGTYKKASWLSVLTNKDKIDSNDLYVFDGKVRDALVKSSTGKIHFLNVTVEPIGGVLADNRKLLGKRKLSVTLAE